MEMKSGIYWIVGPTGKAYIGSSKNVERRLGEHARGLRRGNHGNVHLQNAVNKYGIDAFIFQPIEYCSIAQLIEREQFHIDTQEFDTLYNARAQVEPHASPTLATRAKLSAAQRGRKYSDEARAKMRAAQQGRKHSTEARAKLSAAQSGRKHSNETRAKQSAARPLGESGFKCVIRNGNKWSAGIRVNGKRRHLGTYATPELAYTWRLVYIAQMEWGNGR